MVIATSPFDRHDQITQIVLTPSCLQLGECQVEFRSILFDHRGRDEDIAIEVAEHPLETSLGAIHADDPEMVGTNTLDARLAETLGAYERY